MVLCLVIAVAAPLIAVEAPRSWTVARANFTEFAASSPLRFGITTGPDGNLWFTEAGHVGRITQAGVITEFATPQAIEPTARITSGPDGNVWFTTTSGVGRVTRAGVVSAFDSRFAVFTAFDIAGGPDGNVWVTDLVLGGVGQTPSTSGIGRVTPTGSFTQFDAESFMGRITAGRDGALWFTDFGYDKLGRITTSGEVTYFDAPRGSQPMNIAAAPDGSIWFDERLERLARRDPSGSITEWQLSGGAGFPIVGPDQKIWFWMRGAIGSISTDGAVTEVRVPAPFRVNVITAGPDGNLWFSDVENKAIGRLDVSSITPIPAIPTFSVFTQCLLAATLCVIAFFAIAPRQIS